MLPSVSVVVPALNEAPTIGALLESLSAQDHLGPLEVVVVDNGSTDGTAAVARAYGATVVSCPSRGVVFAREAGFRAAQGDIVIQTDADCVCPPDWVSRHVGLLTEHREAIAVAGEVAYLDEPLWHRPLSCGARRVKRCWYGLRGRPLMIFAANLAAWRAALIAVGGYGDRLPRVGDERLLLERLWDLGPIIYAPSLRIATSSRRFRGRGFQAIAIDLLLRTILPLVLIHLTQLLVWRGPGSMRKSTMDVMPPLAVVSLLVLFLATAAYGYLVPSSQVFGKVHTRQPVSEKLVALTFDDGPLAGPTEEILAILGEYQAQATFFVRGVSVVEQPDLAKLIVESGHELGNHSWSHPKVAPPGGYRKELVATQAAIEENTGLRPTVFRPPYGRKTPWLLWEVKKQGMLPVGWSVSSGDTKQPDPEAVARRVIAQTRPGSIVLLHDGVAGKPSVADRSNTVSALPLIIQALQAEGYSFVTVSALLQSGAAVKTVQAS